MSEAPLVTTSIADVTYLAFLRECLDRYETLTHVPSCELDSADVPEDVKADWERTYVEWRQLAGAPAS